MVICKPFPDKMVDVMNMEGDSGGYANISGTYSMTQNKHKSSYRHGSYSQPLQKYGVYATKVNTRDALLERILNAAEIIKNRPESIRKATSAIHRRADLCLESNGGIFENY
ncbi:hypothetical protein ABEB36_004310 [Hypothenemus hampei]|uniref:Uncharacterized protein n=1 Tax=Hypothenemus hampei TaxID=57062 RepID=A0ABD1F3A2_HYPHA